VKNGDKFEGKLDVDYSILSQPSTKNHSDQSQFLLPEKPKQKNHKQKEDITKHVIIDCKWLSTTFHLHILY